jgi:hypothetical protein
MTQGSEEVCADEVSQDDITKLKQKYLQQIGDLKKEHNEDLEDLEDQNKKEVN